ncbi:MAG: hypothetical protein NUV51_11925 [Sulfuricaulis sp.]|nr:hypothetical protein [Sulfuricaulis sp.]
MVVMDRDGSDVLKARLTPRPQHPRALLTLLEGLSLWSGEILPVVVSAEDPYQGGLFGDELWPAESQLVRFRIASPARRKVRLDGLGDFRAVRNLVEGL